VDSCPGEEGQSQRGSALIDPEKVAVVGGGSWGTAFANTLALKGLKVILWCRRQDLADSISNDHLNSDYLPGTFLSPRLRATSDLQEALEEASVAVMAVPSQGFREVVRDVGSLISEAVPIVSLAKGLEQETLFRMSEVAVQEVPSAEGRVASLSGPNLAKEIAEGYPAAAVIASSQSSVSDHLQELFMSPTFRTYANDDIIGVEFAGVVKNVIAIATGIGEGLGFGDNTRAMVITRGLSEMTRLGVSLGADPLTFSGLAGVGDLICTCMSTLSRNHHVGLELGKGRPIDEILDGMSQVAEGVRSSKAVKMLADRQGVEMPIANGVYQVIHEAQPVSEMVSELLRTIRPRERDDF